MIEQMISGAAGGLQSVASAGGPVIDLDATVLLQALMFIILWFALTYLVFQPYLRARRERGQMTGGARERASEIEARANRLFEEYESKIKAARAQAAEERDALVREGSQRASVELEQARAEATQTLAEQRALIEQERAEVASEIEPQAQRISAAIVEKILAA